MSLMHLNRHGKDTESRSTASQTISSLEKCNFKFRMFSNQNITHGAYYIAHQTLSSNDLVY